MPRMTFLYVRVDHVGLVKVGKATVLLWVTQTDSQRKVIVMGSNGKAEKLSFTAPDLNKNTVNL